jgi:hypothetical protein
MRRAVLAALVGIVMMGRIVSADHFNAVGTDKKMDVVAKPGAVRLSEGIFIKNNAHNRASYSKRRKELAQIWADLILKNAKTAASLLEGPRR